MVPTEEVCGILGLPTDCGGNPKKRDVQLCRELLPDIFDFKLYSQVNEKYRNQPSLYRYLLCTTGHVESADANRKKLEMAETELHEETASAQRGDEEDAHRLAGVGPRRAQDGLAVPSSRGLVH